MKALKHAALCAVVICLCSAQTPAPDRTVGIVPFKAARHLEFSFDVSYAGMQDSQYGAIGSDDSGVGGVVSGGGRRGTLDVDVTGLTSDGGVVVEINEMVMDAARPGQRFMCFAYADGHTVCPNNVVSPSDVENAVLGVLGRGFIDTSKLDSNNHWRRTYTGQQMDVTSDYTVSDAPEGQPVTIVEQTKIVSDTPRVPNTVATAKIVYDIPMAVPDSLHKEATETYRNGTMRITMDLHLTKDSYAKT